MATQILAVGTSTTPSSDITLADGQTMTVMLKSVTGRVSVAVELKDSADAYIEVGALTGEPGRGAAAFITPGTYRFTRRLGSCGVERA